MINMEGAFFYDFNAMGRVSQLYFLPWSHLREAEEFYRGQP